MDLEKKEEFFPVNKTVICKVLGLPTEKSTHLLLSLKNEDTQGGMRKVSPFVLYSG